jgi:chemotaxis family two-component system response regulator Rcp1
MSVHILLVEDNPADIFLVQLALAEYHIVHELHVVEDGGKALAFVARMGRSAAAPHPDVVLLDLNLPKVDGATVLSEFRKHPECATTPVIVVTSSEAREDRARMAALGVAHYFRKPADLGAFLKLGSILREVIVALPR